MTPAPPDKSMLEHVTDDLIWKVAGAIFFALTAITTFFIRLAHKKMTDDVDAHGNAIEEMRKGQAAFERHVAEDYVQRQTLDTHVVEPLRRIEKMLMEHIVANGKG